MLDLFQTRASSTVEVFQRVLAENDEARLESRDQPSDLPFRKQNSSGRFRSEPKEFGRGKKPGLRKGHDLDPGLDPFITPHRKFHPGLEQHAEVLFPDPEDVGEILAMKAISPEGRDHHDPLPCRGPGILEGEKIGRPILSLSHGKARKVGDPIRTGPNRFPKVDRPIDVGHHPKAGLASSGVPVAPFAAPAVPVLASRGPHKLAA